MKKVFGFLIVSLLLCSCTSYEDISFKIFVCYENSTETYNCKLNSKVQIRPHNKDFHSFDYFFDENGNQFTDREGNMINGLNTDRNINIFPSYSPNNITFRINNSVNATFDGNIYNIYAKYGGYMPALPSANLDGYLFVGYTAALTNNQKAVITDGVNYLPGYEKLISEKYAITRSNYLDLEPKFIKDSYSNAKFIYKEGEKLTEKNIVKEVGTNLLDFAPKASNDLDFAWALSSEASFDETIFKTSSENIVLYAIGYLHKTTSNNILFENFERNKTFICDSNFGNSNLTLDFSSNTNLPEEVHINGSNSTNILLEIIGGSNTKIFLNNINIKSNAPFKSTSNNPLEINTCGTIRLESNSNLSITHPVIEAANLKLNIPESSNVTLIGGHGKNGANGRAGTTNNTKGGDGENGSGGADCVRISNSLDINNYGSLTMIAGNGGNGGKGGKGCDGDVSVLGIGKRDGGDGGKSGDGGSGGTALNLLFQTVSFKCLNPQAVFLTGGNGGTACKGGAGGSGKTIILSSAKAGNSGANGTPGQGGKAITSNAYTFGATKDGEAGNLLDA